MGGFAVRTRQPLNFFGAVGNSWSGLLCWGQEITVKVYGVAVMMPQG